MGDEIDEIQLEKYRLLGVDHRRCRPIGRFIEPKWNGNLSEFRSAASAFSTRMAVSCGVGDPLCPHGDRCFPCESDKRISRAKQRTQSDGCPIGGEFLLASVFLQSAGLWFQSFVAPVPVGACALDDPDIQKDFASCGSAADPLSSVADFCCIPQCGGMVFKPIKFTLFFLLFL